MQCNFVSVAPSAEEQTADDDKLLSGMLGNFQEQSVWHVMSCHIRHMCADVLIQDVLNEHHPHPDTQRGTT